MRQITFDYWNTTATSGEQLQDSIKKAQKQQDIVKDFFKENQILAFTPSEVLQRCFNELTPLTSVRRAISNLTAAGYLLKTPQTKLGLYGKPCHLWTWNPLAGPDELENIL